MARSIWSGTITFGLITIPVKLFTAVRHKAVSFNQLDGRNMTRIRYIKVSEVSGEEVPPEQIVKGVEIAKGRYVLVDPDEFAPFVPLATKTIEVEEFVDLAEIDPCTSSPAITSPPTSVRSHMPSWPRRWRLPARWRSSGS